MSPERSHDRDEPYGTLGAAGSSGTDDGGRGPSVATRLVALAKQRYELGCTPNGESYALPVAGPPIVRLLRGGRQSLRAELAHAYHDVTKAVPAQSALADACTVLEGRAQRIEPVPLHLRVAEHEGRLVLDLGDATGRAVVVDQEGWRVVDRPPVLYRRTALTGSLPTPVRGGDVAELWPHLHVATRYRPLVLAVLVAALMPTLPHPIVLLTGEQGTGKTTATSRLAALVDPSPAQVRKPPRDVESWTTAAAGSWVVALDNLSAVPDWLSDALCRASTGDGDVRRWLYTDGDLHVIAFRRVAIINGIDVGAVRGDLADRLVHLVLDRIPMGDRRQDRDLGDQWADAHPRILGALLDLTARVLDVLPAVSVADPPRMADFARIAAAVDQVLGTDGLDVYRHLGRELAEDAADSDPMLVALGARITDPYQGTSAQLLAAITPTRAEDGASPWRAPRGWPASARDMTGVMRRLAPTMRTLGWSVNEQDRADTRARLIRWTLAPPRKWREAVSGAADAATPHHDTSALLNGGATGAEIGAATPRQTAHDAAPMTNAASSTGFAALVAAPPGPVLSSANGDHAANAASAATNTLSLRSHDTWRVSGDPIEASYDT